MLKKEISVQEFLSIAYVYLLILGILSDALFYGILGVSYLSFTTILDALISPISLLTNSWKLSLFLGGMFTLMYLYITKLTPYMFHKYKERKWYRKITNIEKTEKRLESLKNKKNLLIGMAFLFFLFYLSMRLGMGIGMKSKIESADHKVDYTLVFKDNKSLNVKKIGQNSIYFFYVKKDETIVTATPILDNIKEIKRIKK
ncbi:MAG: hypothetical protein JXR05_03910 [Flavobacteriaceae bacterium]